MRCRVQFKFRRTQDGAATLVVVMMLFLIMALLAAYANRGLMFEQRLSGSYFRASLSQEVAEAGVEWTLAQLNGPAVDDACKPVAEGGRRFVDRYLQVDAADRRISAIGGVQGIATDCTRDLGIQGWTCRCPAPNTRTAPSAVSGTDVVPSFGVALVAANRPGTLHVKARGCNDSVIDRCVGSTSMSAGLLARSDLDALVGLVSAVRTPPAAPLVVKGNLDMAGTGLGLHNTDPRSAGLLLVTGGVWSGLNDSLLESVPGTSPAQARVANEATLTALDADVFKMFMGIKATRYVNHPALRKVDCVGDCTDKLEAAYKAGQRMLWVEGPMSISSNKTLGSLSDPVLIIATGAVTLTGPFQLNGMLVSRGNLVWTNTVALPSLISGIVLVEGNMQTNGRMDILYQQTVADQLRNRMGSYVRVPGGWIDTEF